MMFYRNIKKKRYICKLKECITPTGVRIYDAERPEKALPPALSGPGITRKLINKITTKQMQNKGFISTIAILLVLICGFYISFSFVTRHYEDEANRV